MACICLFILILHFMNCMGKIVSGMSREMENIPESEYNAKFGGQLCDSNFTYHKHSHSCMTLVRESMSFSQAKQKCEHNQHGGHLIYILDKETDDFVKKTFLAQGGWPFIGLEYNKSEQLYKWGNKHIAKYEGWKETEKLSKNELDHVYITKDGWRQARQQENTTFICQYTSKINETMFLNLTNFDNGTEETLRGSNNLLECRTYSRTKAQIQLLFQSGNGKLTVFNSTNTWVIYYKFKAQCHMSGLYVCSVNDEFGNQIRRLQGILKVKCEPRYCSEHDKPEIKLTSTDNQDVTKRICVVVYPKPTFYALYYENKQKKVGKSRYNISLAYNNMYSTEGQLEITLYRVNQSDFGKYKIRVEQQQFGISDLMFSIAGSPQCPKNISFKDLSYQKVTLQWRLKYDMVTQPTFTVVKHEVGREVELSKISDATSDVIESNITGLIANTLYKFYIVVSNEYGTTTCKHLMISVTTKDAPENLEQKSEVNIALFVAPPLALFVVLTVGVIVLTTLLKTQKSGSNSEPISPSSQGSSQQTVNVNINLAAAETDKRKSIKKSSRISTSVISDKNDEENFCYTGVSKLTECDALEKPITGNSGRTISPDGLIYISLDITSSRQTSRPVDKEKHSTKPSYEPVEYTTLDYKATAELAVNQNLKANEG